jgi:outer membrane protein OmpA-like peptidoglycan-associated protein
VIEGGCDAPPESAPGVAGIRVYLEDGRYAVTDAEGKYHFEGLAPGSHVAQLDTITLPVELATQRCDSPVRSAGSAISQFVDLRGGGVGTANFVLARRAPPTGDAALELTTTPADRGFAHTATITARGVALADAELLVMLPVGLAYEQDSTKLNGAASEPTEQAGVLRFKLGNVGADGSAALTFATRQAAAPAGVTDLPVQAVLRFATPTERAQQTAPVVNVVHRDAARREESSYTFSPRFDALATEIAAEDRRELDRIADGWRNVADVTVEVVGHTDQTPIAARNRARFPDNYSLSRARAEVVANHLRNALPDAQFIVEGHGAEEPLALGTDAASLARNRRVAIRITGLKTVAKEAFSVATGSAAAPPVPTVGKLETGARTAVPAAIRDSTLRDDPPPRFAIEELEPRVEWLEPAADFAPSVPSLKIAIAHLPSQRVTLTIGGRPVSDLNFDGVESNAAGTVAVSRWRGVDLVDGDNRLVATVHGADDSVAATLERVVRYGAGGVRAELVAEQSLLTADGRTEPVVALRVFDASGKPARPGTLGAYAVDPPYRTAWEVATLHDNPLLVSSKREPTFAVGDDGIVRIALEPTVQTGTVVVRLTFNERQQQEIRAWLAPEQRDWILVGIAEGTAAYTKLSAALQPPDVEDGYTSDGRVAFFAKGRVKGSTLLTVAYDSARDRAEAERRLFGTIEPDRYYTLYGDNVEQRFEAASTRKLYLKIERRAFAALYGDFQTGFTITELGRYSRSLTGVKTDYAGEHVQVSAFAADNRETYGRDELRGDGTSGPYRLSRTDLVANSDRLRIEVRDRIRSDVVVESRLLTRFLDYGIDYLTGIVTFKEPVPGRDAAFNPVYVIAEYETLERNDGGTTAGARATTKLGGEHLELGATLVAEDSATGNTHLAGTDLKFRPNGALEVRAEVAQTSSSDPLRGTAGAYLAELARVTERLDLKAYVREQETGFGFGQQLATETGTRKTGVDARAKIAEHWTARGEALRQENLASGADRELLSAEARRESEDATASFGLRHVVDDLPQSGLQRSDLLSLGGSRDVLDDRITLRALTEQAIGDRAASVDFPERTTLGLDYHLTAATTLFGEIEDATGANIDTTMTRLGVRSQPWAGTQLSSSVNHEFGEYGPRVFATTGLTQSWRIGQNWAMDAGVDQSKTLTGTTPERLNPAVPLVSGNLSEDYLATFVGGAYRAELWTFTSRLERRDAQTTDRRALTTGFFREPLAGRALSLTAHWLDTDTPTGASRVVDTRFSYAYRPVDRRLVVLERLDLQRNDQDDLLASYATARVVNNLNLHWQLGQKLELGTQLGARFARSTIDGERYSGWSSLLGIDLRRDLTKTLDIGLHGSELTSFAAGTRERSFGLDIGINAARNLWLAVGYNFEGFRDDEFDASRYTAAGPYIRFRFKTDQDALRDLDLSRLRPGR